VLLRLVLQLSEILSLVDEFSFAGLSALYRSTAFFTSNSSPAIVDPPNLSSGTAIIFKELGYTY